MAHSCLMEASAHPLTHYARHSSYIGIIPNNPRVLIRHEKIANGSDLSERMKMQGQMRPIVVYPFYMYGHLYFFLLDGHHRAAAALAAGVQGIYANIIGFFPTSHFRVEYWEWAGSVKKSAMFLRGWRGKLYPYHTTKNEVLGDDGRWHPLHHNSVLEPQLFYAGKPGIPMKVLERLPPPINLDAKLDIYLPPPVPLRVLYDTPRHVAVA